ncbi:hypothetical protein PSC71_08180 [Devosia sp. J2-20]|uniref:hypothetical protein n=1 Tax=Devosia sp. J2-20 TaxID=3026161 RepID=UPI00249AC5A8|nr:hypothetical protein [Devosia sp. J2-20]WDR00711.1 hypothetical protein PSC71_08180 [Devosia sp. J2-20]
MRAIFRIEGIPSNIGAGDAKSAHEVVLELPEKSQMDLAPVIDKDINLIHKAFSENDGLLGELLQKFGERDFEGVSNLLDAHDISETKSQEKGGGIILAALAVACLAAAPILVLMK